MTEEEIGTLLQQHGWYLSMQPRRSQGKLYAYAKRRAGKKSSQSRYLGAQSKLAQLTKEALLKRIGE